MYSITIPNDWQYEFDEVGNRHLLLSSTNDTVVWRIFRWNKNSSNWDGNLRFDHNPFSFVIDKTRQKELQSAGLKMATSFSDSLNVILNMYTKSSIVDLKYGCNSNLAQPIIYHTYAKDSIYKPDYISVVAGSPVDHAHLFYSSAIHKYQTQTLDDIHNAVLSVKSRIPFENIFKKR